MCNLPILFYAYPAAFLILLAVSITLNACMLWVRLRERKAGGGLRRFERDIDVGPAKDYG